MDMKIVHIVTSNGKADPIAVGKVKKTSFHGIHYIINTMESMNTNHLNKRNPNKDEGAESKAWRSCWRVSWPEQRATTKLRKLSSRIRGLQSGTLKFNFRNSQGK